MSQLASRVQQCLDQNGVEYTHLPHRRDYTARQTAHDCQLKPSDFAKVVGLESEGRQMLAVLAADQSVDLPRLQRHLRAEHLWLMPESTMASFFPDCEVGACPPLGNLYGLPVYITPALAKRETISFNAGTHEDVIQMRYADFKRLVSPTVVDFAIDIDN